MQDKFIKEKNELENQIKNFKEEKKVFENNCTFINEKINKLNNDTISFKKEEELFNLNKSLFTLINFNTIIGSTEKEINDGIKKKYIDKIDNYIQINNNKTYINFKKDMIEIKRNNSNDKVNFYKSIQNIKYVHKLHLYYYHI